MHAKIAVLPGDGIGQEVIEQARKVLGAVASAYGHDLTFHTALIGGAAIDEAGDPLPQGTLALCRESAAILFGAVGGPRWEENPATQGRPGQGLLELRRALGLYANLRPVRVDDALIDASTIKPDVLAGTDLVVVRELTGGIYYGERGRRDGGRVAYDTMVYSVPEIERVLHAAFRLARGRRGHVTSVDKANVLECSRLWRETAERVAGEYPDVTFEHLLVDACAMHLIRRPATFDVIVTGNMFGDILTDEASMLAGSMGMLPSASLGEGTLGLYEPIHGTAPDIAGRNVANPLGAILSVALLLRHSLGLEREAASVEAAVSRALREGFRTQDIAEPGKRVLSTSQMGDLVAEYVSR